MEHVQTMTVPDQYVCSHTDQSLANLEITSEAAVMQSSELLCLRPLVDPGLDLFLSLLEGKHLHLLIDGQDDRVEALRGVVVRRQVNEREALVVHHVDHVEVFLLDLDQDVLDALSTVLLEDRHALPHEAKHLLLVGVRLDRVTHLCVIGVVCHCHVILVIEMVERLLPQVQQLLGLYILLELELGVIQDLWFAILV